MKVLRWVASIIYGALTIVGAVGGLVQKIVPVWLLLIMLIGGILLIVANFKPFIVKKYFVIFPLLLIQISAILNAFDMRQINVSHHIIRLIISIVIFGLFYLPEKINSKS